MMPLTRIQEELSRAYVNAIIANTGNISTKPNMDFGMDGIVQFVDKDERYGRVSPNGFCLEYQLKASTNVEIKDGYVIYDLEVKNYRDLIREDVGNPRILILYSMPKPRNEWINWSEDQLMLKNCAWWCSLKGLPETNNKDRKRIVIPYNQFFNCEELLKIRQAVTGGVDL